MTILASLALLLASLLPAQSAERPAYAAGQVWEYRTRPQEAGSLLKIQQIETMRGTAVYHVSLIGISVAGGEMQHLPVSRETLDASVTRLSARTGSFPDPAKGMAIWRENQGGVFTIPVAEIVGVIEQSIRDAAPRQ